MKKIIIMLLAFIAVNGLIAKEILFSAENTASVISLYGKIENIATGEKALTWTGGKRPQFTFAVQNIDWTKYGSINLKLYSNNKNGSIVNLVMYTKSGPYFRYPIKVDWTGWKTITLPLNKFFKSSPTIKFNDIIKLGLLQYGWGVELNSELKLMLAEAILVPLTKEELAIIAKKYEIQNPPQLKEATDSVFVFNGITDKINIDLSSKQGKKISKTVKMLQTDWTKHNAIQLQIYSNSASNGALNLVIYPTSNALPPKPYYRFTQNINWTGWKTVTIPLQKLVPSYKPDGLQNISSFYIMNYGWAIEPVANAEIYCSAIRLINSNDLLTHASARITPISMGGALISPFFDAYPTEWNLWECRNDNAKKVSANKTWCLVKINYETTTKNGGITLRRSFGKKGLNIAPYDQLVLSAGFAPDTEITLIAKSKKEKFSKTFTVKKSYTSQYYLPLNGAKEINEVEIKINSPKEGSYSGNLIYLGLLDSAELEHEKKKWENFTKQPLDIYINEQPTNNSLLPIYNILTSADGFLQARENYLKNNKDTKLNIKQKVKFYPHTAIANQQLFGREVPIEDFTPSIYSFYDKNNRKLTLAYAATIASLSKDAESLKEVAKGAILIAMTPQWDVDFLTKYPGGTFQQGAFEHSSFCYQLAVALDLAGVFLSREGRHLIERRLIEEGLSSINFDLWTCSHRHHSNQLPVFSLGRLSVYSTMEKGIMSVKNIIPPYSDLAYDELNACLGRIFFSDGGFFEGTGYLGYTISLALPAIAVYSNMRDKKISDLLVDSIKNIDDYLAVVRSTTNNGSKMVLLSSAQGGPITAITPSALNFLAKINPNKTAARMLKSLQKKPTSFELWTYPIADLSKTNSSEYREFIILKESGITASTRKSKNGILSKIIFIGNGKKSNGHFHHDRGSFVIEYNNEHFFVDPGGIIYSDMMSDSMKLPQNHNMLVPITENGEYEKALIPYNMPCIPTATGDAIKFEGSISPTIFWGGAFENYERKINSPNAETFTIIDEYDLDKKYKGTEFILHTPNKIEEKDGKVFVTSPNGAIAEITPAVDAKIKIIPPRKLGTWQLGSIIFYIDGSGKKTVTTNIKFSKKERKKDE